MKRKLEDFLCIVVFVIGVCAMIAMFLLTHPKILKAVVNEVHQYSVVGFTNARPLSKGGNGLRIYSSPKL